MGLIKKIVEALWLLAFLIKLPMPPLHTWLPPLYSRSSPKVAVASTVLVKMSAYGLIIVHSYLSPSGLYPLAILSLIGGVYAVLNSYRFNENYRLMGSYLSIAHMSLIPAVLLYPGGKFRFTRASSR